MTETLVRYQRDDTCHAAIITLDRPHVRNALTNDLMEQALAAVREAHTDPDLRSIILTGRGKAFAAGADLHELLERDHRSETSTRSAQRRELAAALENGPKPTIAAINGHAAGGGLELALACTFRLAARSAKVGLPEVNVGIMPGNGGTQRLTRLIGTGRALEMILLGEMVDAVTAHEMGLVNRVVAADALMDEARNLAQRLSTKPRRSLQAAKEAVLMAWDLPASAGISYENKWFAILCGSPDKTEGVAAFREGRNPRFNGKEKNSGSA